MKRIQHVVWVALVAMVAQATAAAPGGRAEFSEHGDFSEATIKRGVIPFLNHYDMSLPLPSRATRTVVVGAPNLVMI